MKLNDKNEKLKTRIENNNKMLSDDTFVDPVIRARREGQRDNLQKLLDENTQIINRLKINKDGYERKFKKLEKITKGEEKVKSVKQIIDTINSKWEEIEEESDSSTPPS